MTQPATHRVTVDGTEYSYSGIIVEVTDCAPTYALSHRWGWPDENGVMRCACGVTDLEDDIAHAVPCRIYAVALEAGHSGPVSVEVLGLWADDYNLTQLDPVEAERQRCERLGVVWVGPDVQEMPTRHRLVALGLSETARRALVMMFAEEHFINPPLWSEMQLNWVYPDISEAHDLRAALADGIAEEQAFRREHSGQSCPSLDHGGIVRLGCELREADGVRAR